MSRFVFNPNTKELEYAIPTGAEIPESAFAMNQERTYVQESTRTSPILVALIVTLIVLLILAAAYLVWFMFIKTSDQTPLDIFSWFIKPKTP